MCKRITTCLRAARLSFLLVVAAASGGCGGAADPPDVDDLRVVERRDATLDGRRLLSLSPDGARVLSVSDTELCVHETARLGRRRCADVRDREPETSTASWSPDGRRVAFVEDWWVRSLDGDVWVLDTQTGALRDLTDDGVAGVQVPTADPDARFDGTPAWTPDGRSLLFTRSWADSTEIWRVPVTGGPPWLVGTAVARRDAWVAGRLVPTPDGRAVLYTVVGGRDDASELGLWSMALAGGARRRLAAPDPALRTALLQVAPTAGRALVAFTAGSADGRDGYALLELASGRIAPLQASGGAARRYTRNATLSPDGRSLLSAHREHGRSGDVVAVRNMVTGTERVLLDHHAGLVSDAGVFSGLHPVLSWGRNGAVLVHAEPAADVLLRLAD